MSRKKGEGSSKKEILNFFLYIGGDLVTDRRQIGQKKTS